MKKTFFKILIACIIAVTISILSRQDVFYGRFSSLEIGKNAAVKLEEKHVTINSYYYTQLTEEEQKIYLKVAEASDNLVNEIFFESIKDVEVIKSDINRAVVAYIYDNPQAFYFDSNYKIKISNFVIFKDITVEFIYASDDRETIDNQKKQIDLKITDIINKNITEDMNEYEKELVVHDTLVKTAKYYDYEDINNIPGTKHSAYGALIEGEAVCDGISKAFKMVMDKLGIECILVGGVLNDVPHAWNMIKIDGGYYHVDLTSDQLSENKINYATHTYFNLTDEEIDITHEVDDQYVLNKCIEDKYNYYQYNKYYIDNSEVTKVKLNTIIFNSTKQNVLEFKVSDQKANSEAIVNLLYQLNFNEYQTRGKTKIGYRKIKDIYVVIKD